MTVRIGVAGLGYWGPNLARNFAAIEGCELAWCCDGAAAARERWAPAFPGARFTASLDDLLADTALDAVVLATPVPTHGELAERVLRAGKHCFVEKPLAQSVAEGERAVAAAEEAGRLLMVGHLLEYHPGVARLKELTESGELVGSEGLTTLNAKTVRVHNGVPAITDGPFTEAKEYLAGYYMVDCASLERATEIAARLPEAQYAPVEVRQFMGKDHMQR